MKNSQKGKLLRIFIDEADKHKGKPLYEHIIRTAKDKGISYAVAIKGFQGFRANSQIHTAKLLRLSENLPIIIEIIDEEDKIAQFLSYFDEIIKEGIATLEDINITLYTDK